MEFVMCLKRVYLIRNYTEIVLKNLPCNKSGVFLAGLSKLYSMIKRFTLVFFLCAIFLHPPQTFAQDLDSLLKLNAFTEESDLQKELNKGTKVGSGKALSTRE